jgi:phosphotransferase system  glucose/maltose/N-acetylglucosamine-specific IIC component
MNTPTINPYEAPSLEPAAISDLDRETRLLLKAYTSERRALMGLSVCATLISGFLDVVLILDQQRRGLSVAPGVGFAVLPIVFLVTSVLIACDSVIGLYMLAGLGYLFAVFLAISWFFVESGRGFLIIPGFIALIVIAQTHRVLINFRKVKELQRKRSGESGFL